MSLETDALNILPPIPSVHPCHPELIFNEDRLGTFNTWPKQMMPDKYSLSEAGFYYSGWSDIAVCAFCNLRLSEWHAKDLPMNEHLIHAPNCTYLKMIGCGERKTEAGLDIPPFNTSGVYNSAPLQPSLFGPCQQRTAFSPPSSIFPPAQQQQASLFGPNPPFGNKTTFQFAKR